MSCDGCIRLGFDSPYVGSFVGLWMMASESETTNPPEKSLLCRNERA